MGIVDLKTGEEKKLKADELRTAAKDMRGLALISIHAARSGHPGGSLSIMDIAAALFLNEAKLSPDDDKWKERDRIFFSAGHKAPALYAGLVKAGFYSPEEMVTLRQLDSPFQGHPHAPKLKGVEVSSGSLGQGLSVAAGVALYGKLEGSGYRVYCIMGDGEQQEGNIWEAAMTAGHYKLDNLCAVLDKNRLQIDGWVKDVMSIDPIADKYRAFNWNVIEINGHDMDEILSAFKKARETKGKPTIIIADTVKGKGVSFMENVAGWHGVATKDLEQLKIALDDVGSDVFNFEYADKLLEIAENYRSSKKREVQSTLPAFNGDFWWNSGGIMHVNMEPTRVGFGRCLASIGDDPRIVTIHADISNSIKISDFEKDRPERKLRVFNSGIAEQNMMVLAAGFALEGKIPITGTYGVFASGRPWDQIRTTICYDNLNVKIAGAHGGVSVGADGATHQALEEIALMSILPNMNLFVPCDSVETKRLSEMAILDIHGPAYIRYAREATPVVTAEDTPLIFGKVNVIRFREERPEFKDAFETSIGENYKDESEDVTLVACGPMVAEAMRAAYILKKMYNLETRILDVHTVKPLDTETIVRAAEETGAVITCEEHQTGGFGNIIAGTILKANGRIKRDKPLVFNMIGVNDRFGESGDPWDLMIRFGLTAEHIASRVKKLIG